MESRRVRPSYYEGVCADGVKWSLCDTYGKSGKGWSLCLGDWFSSDIVYRANSFHEAAEYIRSNYGDMFFEFEEYKELVEGSECSGVFPTYEQAHACVLSGVPVVDVFPFFKE